MTTNNVITLYPKRASVEKMIEMLAADDPEWTYLIEAVGPNRFKINVYDENGEFVGSL